MKMAVGNRSIANLKAFQSRMKEQYATVPLMQVLIYISEEPQCLSLRDDVTPPMKAANDMEILLLSYTKLTDGDFFKSLISFQVTIRTDFTNIFFGVGFEVQV